MLQHEDTPKSGDVLIDSGFLASVSVLLNRMLFISNNSLEDHDIDPGPETKVHSPNVFDQQHLTPLAIIPQMR